MTDETPKDEIENEKDGTAEHEETDTETTEGNEDSSARPYIRYTSLPRRGSIWNSPLGLVTTFLIASKVIDLAYRAMMEHEKTKRAEHQKKQPQQ